MRAGAEGAGGDSPAVTPAAAVGRPAAGANRRHRNEQTGGVEMGGNSVRPAGPPPQPSAMVDWVRGQVLLLCPHCTPPPPIHTSHGRLGRWTAAAVPTLHTTSGPMHPELPGVQGRGAGRTDARLCLRRSTSCPGTRTAPWASWTTTVSGPLLCRSDAALPCPATCAQAYTAISPGGFTANLRGVSPCERDG